jgi:hypothetical protein
VVPVTAHSEDEAKEIALYLFKEYKDLSINAVRDINKDETKPAPLLN